MGPSRLWLSKPVIAAIDGPAVGGGMELALWADCHVMADGAYMGMYNRRWGCPYQMAARCAYLAWSAKAAPSSSF